MELRFKHEVLSQPGTFSQTDLSSLLNYWTDTLHAVRDAYQAGQAPHAPKIALTNEKPMDAAQSADLRVVPSKIHAAAETGNELDIDTALATLPLGPSGTRATYWVHAEQVVEIHILLLQSLRLFEGKATRSQPSSPLETVRRRDSSDGLNDRADDVGAIFIDELDRYARQRSSTTVEDTEETSGKPAARVLGSAYWNASGEAAVSVPSEIDHENSEATVFAKLKRKHLGSLLSLDRSSTSRRPSGLSPIAESVSEADPVDDLHSWLLSHRNFRPVAGICAKRSRFVGMDNDSDHGIWAMLDREICMKASMGTDLGESDWPNKVRSGAAAFPFAVLEIRCEGAQTNDLIRVLDNSHLVSFSPLGPHRIQH